MFENVIAISAVEVGSNPSKFSTVVPEYYEVCVIAGNRVIAATNCNREYLGMMSEYWTYFPSDAMAYFFPQIDEWGHTEMRYFLEDKGLSL